MRRDRGSAHALAEEVMLLEQEVAQHISGSFGELAKEIGSLMCARTDALQEVMQTVVTLKRHNTRLRQTMRRGDVGDKPANLLMKAIRIANNIERTYIVSLKCAEAEAERQLDEAVRKIEGMEMSRRSDANDKPVSTIKKLSIASPRLQQRMLKTTTIKSRKLCTGLG